MVRIISKKWTSKILGKTTDGLSWTLSVASKMERQKKKKKKCQTAVIFLIGWLVGLVLRHVNPLGYFMPNMFLFTNSSFDLFNP